MGDDHKHLPRAEVARLAEAHKIPNNIATDALRCVKCIHD